MSDRAESAYRAYTDHHNACDRCRIGDICDRGRVLLNWWVLMEAIKVVAA